MKIEVVLLNSAHIANPTDFSALYKSLRTEI